LGKGKAGLDICGSSGTVGTMFRKRGNISHRIFITLNHIPVGLSYLSYDFALRVKIGCDKCP